MVVFGVSDLIGYENNVFLAIILSVIFGSFILLMVFLIIFTKRFKKLDKETLELYKEPDAKDKTFEIIDYYLVTFLDDIKDAGNKIVVSKNGFELQNVKLKTKRFYSWNEYDYCNSMVLDGIMYILLSKEPIGLDENNVLKNFTGIAFGENEELKTAIELFSPLKINTKYKEIFDKEKEKFISETIKIGINYYKYILKLLLLLLMIAVGVAIELFLGSVFNINSKYSHFLPISTFYLYLNNKLFINSKKEKFTFNVNGFYYCNGFKNYSLFWSNIKKIEIKSRKIYIIYDLKEILNADITKKLSIKKKTSSRNN
jgi:hypothetical protein